MRNDLCKWFGTLDQIEGHFEKEHLQFIVVHPYTIKPSLNQTNDNVYLMKYNNFTFLIYIKTNSERQSVNFCVTLIGHKRFCCLFKYLIQFCLNKRILTHIDIVKHCGTLMETCDDNISYSQSGLTSILGNYEDLDFKLRYLLALFLLNIYIIIFMNKK